MKKIYKLLFLLLVSLCLLSSCNTSNLHNVEDGIQATDAQDDDSSSSQSTITDEIGDPPFAPDPIFETRNSNEYEMLLQSEECSWDLFSLDVLECFGDFSSFSAYSLTDITTVDLIYRFQFEQIGTTINVTRRDFYYSNDEYLSWFGDIYVEEVDMPDVYCKNPDRHWRILAQEDERIYWAYIEKYNIDDCYIHFRVNDAIVLRWLGGNKNIPEIVFWYDDYVIELTFEPEDAIQKGWELICTNPTIRALLTPSTCREAAEELYNLWKDALS